MQRSKSKERDAGRKTSSSSRTSCGERPPAFGGADSVARPPPAPDGNRSRRPSHCAAWPLRVPHDHLVFEFDAVRSFNAVTHVRNEREHVPRAGFSRVDKKIGEAVADARVADAQAFEAEFINHSASGC